MRYFAFLSVLVLLSLSQTVAFAHQPSPCGTALNLPTKTTQTEPSILELAQAEEIIGTGEASQQIRRALQFVADNSQSGTEEKIKDLRTLLWAIGISHLFTWDFTEISGPQRSHLFVGHSGHFIWVHKEGRLFQGFMDPEREINRRGLWSGRYESLEEIRVSKR